jgi:GNAT superfamily N-acetyltransferase
MSRGRNRGDSAPDWVNWGENLEIGIRQASAEDVDAVRQTVATAYRPYRDRIGRDPAPVSSDYGALIAAREVWVACTPQLVGVLVVRQVDTALLIENVAVTPSAHGHGIGRALLAFAERQAGELHLSEVRLYTNQKMKENIGFYLALGYEETGRRHDEGFDRVFFRKVIRTVD